MFLFFFTLLVISNCYFSSSVMDNTVSCIPEERAALLDFKQGLVDDYNILSSWVTTDEECCAWYGITCNNRTGHIVKLDLHSPSILVHTTYTDYYYDCDWNLNLRGELKSSLLTLKHLQYLDLSCNIFEGNFPRFLGSFNQLQYLNLSHNYFHGRLPHQLGNLTSLQYLDLEFCIQYNFVSILPNDVQWISHLSSLKYLNLRYIYIVNGVHLFQTLNTMQSIIEIHLAGCRIHTIPLALPQLNFTLLSALDLSSNSINSTIPSWFFNISSLTYLNLGSNQLRGNIPTAIDNLSLLKFLDLSANNFEPEDFIMSTSLGKLCHLETLIFSSIDIIRDLSELSGVFGGCLKNSLQSLDLSYTGVQGQLPDWLWDLRNLTSLLLPGNLISGSIPRSIGKLYSLQQLDLSWNQLNGTISESIGKLFSLQQLDLSYNRLNGTIPKSLGELHSLQRLDLSYNQLNEIKIIWSHGELYSLEWLDLSNNMLRGSITEGLGKLSKLVLLDLSNNFLNGTLSHAHFNNLTSLKHLDFSGNSLTLKIESGWFAPFQLEDIYMESCNLGPHFPSWLQTQENLTYINIARTGIVDSSPYSFWNSFPKVKEINMSINQIGGRLPNLTHLKSLYFLDLNSNHFEGSLPYFPSSLSYIDLSNNTFSGAISGWGSTPYLEILLLSSNYFSSEIPLSLCQLQQLILLDLSSNHLFGKIPDCWNYNTYISTMDFSNNKNISGGIPKSIGNLTGLNILYLADNNLSGEIPTSLVNCVHLKLIDFRNNNLNGEVPIWIGEHFHDLMVLNLRSNMMHGNIPPNLSNCPLRVLDLAGNKFSGAVRQSFGNFDAMRSTHIDVSTLRNTSHHREYVIITTKGTSLNYYFIGVNALDLSDNNLSGDVPIELTRLLGLISLNLSRNHLTGEIPEEIGNLKELESLDLSVNELSGIIPSSITTLNSLSVLNLSYNYLAGEIPQGRQMQTFDNASFYGNPKLCGFPLSETCSNRTKFQNTTGDDDTSEIIWSYIGIIPAFVVGFWVVWGTLLLNTKWKNCYFSFIDRTLDAIYVLVVVNLSLLKRKISVSTAQPL